MRIIKRSRSEWTSLESVTIGGNLSETLIVSIAVLLITVGMYWFIAPVMAKHAMLSSKTLIILLSCRIALVCDVMQCHLSRSDVRFETNNRKSIKTQIREEDRRMRQLEAKKNSTQILEVTVTHFCIQCSLSMARPNYNLVNVCSMYVNMNMCWSVLCLC